MSQIILIPISNLCLQSGKSYFQKSVPWGSRILEKIGKMRSNQFLYWNNLIEKVFPVLQDLTCSHRGNWQLPIKYPLIYESFLDGEFVVKLSKRSASAVPMDEALE